MNENLNGESLVFEVSLSGRQMGADDKHLLWATWGLTTAEIVGIARWQTERTLLRGERILITALVRAARERRGGARADVPRGTSMVRGTPGGAL